ncbi:MAG: nicotinamide mononucleotide deamidase-related protein [Candidatus Brockarchaeota archaeon]|nr:nicotinamide mononucleotide deamidase-related protein [Candidatus Brockarchaeota archaeon]
MQLTCEIISVGNELLIGKVVNTNASWLADKLTKLGVAVKKIIVVGDDLDEIFLCVKEALSRRPSFIITTGGLGPTYDDKTLEGLAIALGRKLTLNLKALEMVKRKYESMGESLTEARIKMAKMPEGAEPLYNPVGTAPAAKISYESTVIYALPGVPREMEAIFNETVSKEVSLSSGFKIAEHSFCVIGVMESALAPIISKVKEQHPEVYIKSHPKGTEEKPLIHIYLNTFHKDEIVAKRIVSEAAEKLISLVKESYGEVVHPIEEGKA